MESDFNYKQDIYRHNELAKVHYKNEVYWTYYYPIDQFYGVIYVPVVDMQGQPFEDELRTRLLVRWLSYVPPKKETKRNITLIHKIINILTRKSVL